MSDKTFRRIITAVIAMGTLVTGGLMWYTVHLHGVCSIVSYVANGR